MVQKTEQVLVDEHMPIVFAVLRKIKVSGHLFEDALQEGRFAALRAIRSYRPDSGARMTTWVYNRVRWAMYDWMGYETKAATGVSDRSVSKQGPKHPVEPCEPREGLSVDVRAILASLPEEAQEAAAGLAAGESFADLSRPLGHSEHGIYAIKNQLAAALAHV